MKSIYVLDVMERKTFEPLHDRVMRRLESFPAPQQSNEACPEPPQTTKCPPHDNQKAMLEEVASRLENMQTYEDKPICASSCSSTPQALSSCGDRAKSTPLMHTLPAGSKGECADETAAPRIAAFDTFLEDEVAGSGDDFLRCGSVNRDQPPQARDKTVSVPVPASDATETFVEAPSLLSQQRNARVAEQSHGRRRGSLLLSGKPRVAPSLFDALLSLQASARTSACDSPALR